MTQPQYKTHRAVTVHLDERLIEGLDDAVRALKLKSRTQFINIALSAAVIEAMKQAKKEVK